MLDEQGNLFVVDRAVRELLESDNSVGAAPLANKPPRRVGAEACRDKERKRPHPLKAKGDAPSPLGRVPKKASEDTSPDEVADDPAEVDESRTVVTQLDWSYLNSVGGYIISVATDKNRLR